MLHRMDKLIGLSIVASDGEVGVIGDLYFDRRRWAIRYLAVETGDWLDSRTVLISPMAIDSIDWDSGTVGVSLTREQVRGSPDIDTRQPILRSHEIIYFQYYGYPDYMDGPLLWGMTPNPTVPDLAPPPARGETVPGIVSNGVDEQHLRPATNVRGWLLEASDDSIGHFEDFIFDSGSWAMRYLVVEAPNWWQSRHIVVPVQWVLRLDQDESRIYIDALREQISAAPEYKPALEMSRDYELQLFGHYQRPAYWH